jgi:predicted DNA-binding protein (UPF0251 family)
MTSHDPDGLQLARTDFSVSSDPRVSSLMALWRRIQELPEVKRALAVKPAKVVGGPKAVKAVRKKAARITEKDVAEMNRLYYVEKLPLGEVAERVGCSFPCAWNHVRKGKTHKK